MVRNWAVCIGINNYLYMRSLKYAVQDAEMISNWIKDLGTFEKVYLFTDRSDPINDMTREFPTQPTHSNFLEWIGKRFKKQNKPPLSFGDSIWFFFSGHGCRYKGKDYLLFENTSSIPEHTESTAISIDLITQYFRACGAGNIILFIDACRDSTKQGYGLHLNEQQGIVSISSCSPDELSYEIDELQHGSFTYALHESLQLRGENNCATVERLCKRLRHRVNQINTKYKKQRQTVYEVIQPAAKYYSIILPSQASIKDVETLKIQAYEAEDVNLELAEKLWTQVLVMSPADPQALAKLKSIWFKDETLQYKLQIRQLKEKYQSDLQQLEKAYESKIVELKKVSISYEETEQAKEDLQRHVIRLLDDVEGAARGDLTVQATVTADVLGAVADVFNLTIESSRMIVRQVKEAAKQVNKVSTDSELSAQNKSKQALRIAEKLATNFVSIQMMVKSIEIVADKAREAEEVARSSSVTALKGGKAVERTVSGIFQIRETISETARKVKRLAEASQEISKIVLMISQIAERTNHLALNASIQAAKARETGHNYSFALVTDEIRQLADRSGKSLKGIEQIVLQIQSETGSVMTAMEEGIQEVIDVTERAEQAKTALEDIIQVSNRTDTLVRSIASDTEEQRVNSHAAVRAMQLAELTARSASKEFQQLIILQQNIANIASELLSSVDRFKINR